MSSTTIPAEILAFADSVRRALSDLPGDEVDDLTDGLEADLAEEYAGENPRPLPEPSAYATELRSAAGLPLRAKTPTGLSAALDTLGRHLDRVWNDALRSVRHNPQNAAALEFFAAITPAWWVIRAYVTAWLLLQIRNDGVVGWSPLFLLVFAIATVISVQLGRRRWTFPGVDIVTKTGNLIVALIVLLYGGAVFAGSPEQYAVTEDYEEAFAPEVVIPQALSEAGVGNIYAYDAQGEPLEDVQLFDQSGRPINTINTINSDDAEVCDDYACVQAQPARLVTGSSVFNVFPLTMVAPPEESDFGDEVDWQDIQKESPLLNAPFVRVPAVDSLDEGTP